MSRSIIPVISKKDEYSYVPNNEYADFHVNFCSFFLGREACAISQIRKDQSGEFELRIVLNGECELRGADGKIFSVRSNQFLTIPKWEEIQLNYLSDDCIQLVILFDYTPPAIGETDSYNVIFGQLKKLGIYPMGFNMVSLANIIKNVSQAYKCDYKALSSVYLFALFTEASRIVIANKSSGLLHRYDEPRIEKAVRYIEKNISGSIDTVDVAKRVYLSEKQINRLFLGNFGVSVYEYICKYKHSLSRRLLAETSTPISEIAEQTGFSEATSFSRFFKRYEGVSPAKFRAMSKMEMFEKTQCPK